MINLAIDIRRRIGHWLNGRKAYVPKEAFAGPLENKKRTLILVRLGKPGSEEALALAKRGIMSICPKCELLMLCEHTDNSAKAGLTNSNSGDSEFKTTYISDKGKEYFTERDLSFFFKIKSERLVKLLEETYDVALFIGSDSTPITEFVAQYVKASLRVGVAGLWADNSGVLNMSVGVSKQDIGKDEANVTKILESICMMFSK